MAKRRMGIIIFSLCLFLCFLPCYVQAASTASANEPISVDKECSLDISYFYDGMSFFNMAVKLYQIAEVSEDYQYSLASSFVGTGLNLNGIQNSGEWDVICSTLEAYICANGIEADYATVTNQEGKAYFEALRPGLYLVITDPVAQGDFTYFFHSAIVTLPDLNPDGHWQYQVAMSAKTEVVPPSDEEIKLKVLKLWKRDQGRTDRPRSVEVEIFRNNTSYQRVTLSEANHWSYSWATKADGAKWTVIERNIPSGYIMTVEERKTSFVLTNTRIKKDPDRPTKPQTGDDFNVMLYIILMNITGIVLVVIGILGKRKRL